MRIRQAMLASGILTLSILLFALRSFSFAAEQHSIRSLDAGLTSAGPVTVLRNSLGQLNWFNLFASPRFDRFALPVQPRVSHSARMLRQCELSTGDHFVGELMGWSDDSAVFRLQSGQQIRLPIASVVRISNPPGEVDVIDKTFEADSNVRKKAPSLIDETHSAEGSASLKIIEPYRIDFGEPLESVRIEFLFHISADSSSDGRWQLSGENDSKRESPITVKVRDGMITCADLGGRQYHASTQSLSLTTGWHSFIAIASPDAMRLIVDQSTLASFPSDNSQIKSIEFRPESDHPTAPMLIDALQVRRLTNIENRPLIANDQDSIELATGDVWLGKLKSITQVGATLQEQSRTNIVPLNKIVSITRVPSPQPIRQTAPATAGFFAKIDMQPFVDRPDCPPEHWTVTVIRSDSEQVTGVHPLVGELAFRWADIAQIQTEFFGQSFLLEGRNIHLGNSIRPDFQQPFPVGTHFQSAFRLKTIPIGQPFISMNVSEMEAAGINAPPASPFLAELRAGRLVTELFINEKRVGDLNSLIRFKAKSPSSDRIRIPFSRELLRAGQNTVELSQKSLSDSQHEFDDCEIRQLRVEFDRSDLTE